MIDEGFSLNRQVIEALIECFHEHNVTARLLIVGKRVRVSTRSVRGDHRVLYILHFTGDVQQIPPINGNSREETVEASIVSSDIFSAFHTFVLTKQCAAVRMCNVYLGVEYTV